MKTKLSTLCILSLLLSACGDNADTPAGQGGTRGGVLLSTELPPELNEGTPPPIRLPLQTPMSRSYDQSSR